MKINEYISNILFVVLVVGVSAFISVFIRNMKRNMTGNNEDFYNTSTSSTSPSISTSTRYCAGCHAHLPPSAERNCPPNRCTANNSDVDKCNCCGKPLSRLEREDIHLYGYLTALLNAMGVEDSLH